MLLAFNVWLRLVSLGGAGAALLLVGSSQPVAAQTATQRQASTNLGTGTAPTNVSSQTGPGSFPVEWRRARVHDPSTVTKCKAEYWIFSTGMGIVSRHSKDLVNWTEGPRVFTQPPAWTTNAVPGNRGYFWAPDLVRLGERYCLYYSVSTWGKKTSAIGLATNPTLDPADPRYAWSDSGIVVRTTGQEPYNAIDPSLLLDRDGRLWMAFGSYWSGIKLVELDPQTGLRSATNSALYSLAWNHSIEAACLYRHGANYYLFVNWGQCCQGTNSTYEIRVGRSSKVAGPYLDREGKDLLQGGGSLVLASAGCRLGPGHAAILSENGKEFFSYHFYHAGRGGCPMLEIAPLSWSADGWPGVGAPLPVRQE